MNFQRGTKARAFRVEHDTPDRPTPAVYVRPLRMVGVRSWFRQGFACRGCGRSQNAYIRSSWEHGDSSGVLLPINTQFLHATVKSCAVDAHVCRGSIRPAHATPSGFRAAA
jgi:hypothetical protein